CYDNCNPDDFQVENMVLVSSHQLKAGHKEKSPPELEGTVRKKLNVVREQIIATDYPNQHFLTGNIILSDDIVDILAKRARFITSVEAILQQTYWIHVPKYGVKVVDAIQELLLQFPDLVREARETQTAER
ncbi:hypothetical protein B0H17DRAFT_862780, partial [Mycena rosella]